MWRILTALFNVFFWKEEFATVPSGWMEGIVIPLHKGGGGVTGTLKHVKSSVARSGGVVLRWSSGYGAGGQFLRPGLDHRSRQIC